MTHIELVTERHDNDSGQRYLQHRVAEMSPGEAGQTVMMTELPVVMNGVLQAFYRGEISEGELRAAIVGYCYGAFRADAEQEVDTIIAAKERGIPVVAYDPRDTIEAATNGGTALERIVARKMHMRETELADFNKQIAERQAAGEDTTALEAARDERMALIDQSVALLTRTQNDPLAQGMDTAIRQTMARPEFQGPDNIAAKAEVAAAVAITEAQQALGRDRALILAGEGHIAGEVVERLETGQIGFAGMLDDALKAEGATVRLVSVRSSSDQFVEGRPEPGSYKLAQHFDEYVIFEPDGNMRRYRDVDDLATAALNEGQQEVSDPLAKGETQIGMAGSPRQQKGLPVAKHSQFAGLIDHELLASIDRSLDLKGAVGNSVPVATVKDRSETRTPG